MVALRQFVKITRGSDILGRWMIIEITITHHVRIKLTLSN